jgi:hypothetical protein
MNPVTPTQVLLAAYGTVATPGTVTGTGIDFSPTYEQDFSYFASCGAVSAGGTAVAHVQGSDVVGSGYTSLGSASFIDAAGGTTVTAVDVTGGNRYYRSLITVVGGTVTGGISAGIIAKPRTI